MAVTLDRAVEASEIVDALKPFGVTQVDVAAVIQVSDRAVRGWRTGDIRPERYDRLAQLRDLVLLLSDSPYPPRCRPVAARQKPAPRRAAPG